MKVLLSYIILNLLFIIVLSEYTQFIKCQMCLKLAGLYIDIYGPSDISIDQILTNETPISSNPMEYIYQNACEGKQIWDKEQCDIFWNNDAHIVFDSIKDNRPKAYACIKAGFCKFSSF